MPADSEGSLRAELLGKLLGAQAELESQLAELQRASGMSSLVLECNAQLSGLYALQRNVSGAAPGALATLRSEVATSIASASIAAQQARGAAAGNMAAMSAELAAVSAATRSEVQALSKDLFERRIFDKDLSFASREDEDAYRQREAEKRRYIAEQLRRHTPEGDLNAAGAATGHMLDMETHGAARNPEFIARRDRMIEAAHRQREALRREGRSTDEYDRNLVEDVRRFLKAKGHSETEIASALASSPDPLEAVKPYLKTEQDARDLDRGMQLPERTIQDHSTPVTMAQTLGVTLQEQAKQAPGLDDVMAKLRASGVAAAEQQPHEPAAHGVPAQERPALSTKSRLTL